MDANLEMYRQVHFADPGDAQTIRVSRFFTYVSLVSATAETRTLAAPDRVGVLCVLEMKTDGGDITLTVTNGYNEDGDTTFTFANTGEFLALVAVDVGGTKTWRKIADHMTGNVTATELGWLSGVTAGTGVASKAVVLDSGGSFTFPSGTGEVAFDGNGLATSAGTGFTTGTGTIYKNSVLKVGGVIETRILFDLTGLDSVATDLDIVGTGVGPAHMGQITAAKNGTILGGTVRCLEVPAGGDPNVAFYSATVATGALGDGIAALTETLIFDPNADWTVDMDRSITGMPPANDYLYVVQGDATGTNGTYTAGKFLITLWGYDA